MTLTIPRPDPAVQARRDAFMAWQCRERQMMMRVDQGRPGPAVAPEVVLPGQTEPVARIVTVMSKRGPHARTPEFQHIVRRTNDPAARREAGLKLLSELYYQRPQEFADMLTASFGPASALADAIHGAERCALNFDAHGQRWHLACRVWRLAAHNPLWQATYWHNRMFNPALTEEAVILGFEPDWARSREGGAAPGDIAGGET